MEPNTVSDIVSRILNSTELRHNLEHTVRNLNQNLTVTSSTTPNPTNSLPITIHHQPAQSVRDELHRLFPTIRRGSPTMVNTRGTKRKRNKTVQTYFYKDIILLKTPNTKCTLKGASKSSAFEQGFGLSNAQFNCDWTCKEILANINDLFKKQLQGKEIEIMVPMAGRLIKPSLPPGTELDGRTMKSIFHQKIIYIRPLEPLIFSADSVADDLETDDDTLISEQATNIIGVIGPIMNELGYRTDTQSRTKTTSSPNNDIEIILDDEDPFSADLDLAISNSLNDITCHSDNTLQAIITNLNKQVNDEKFNHFNIYREDIFQCCIRAMRRKSFCPFNKISVKFSDVEGNGEGAVDAGGPTREMFRLVLKYIENSRLFFGENKKYVRLDMDTLGNSEYFEAGRLISLSLIHGGPGPHFFSDSFYAVLISGISNNYPTINDVEHDLREKISKVESFTDITALQEYLIEESVFSIAGYEFIKTLEERNKLLKDVIQFYGYHRIRPALEQFKEGLKTGNILELMERYPDTFKNVMCSDKMKITANVLENLFVVELSEVGSSKRTQENRAISFWRDFLMDCEDNSAEITLQDVFIFATGADTVPPLGFDNTPKIVFEYNDTTFYPRANTCSLQLHLPTAHKKYDDFKYHLEFGIGNCKDFGYA